MRPGLEFKRCGAAVIALSVAFAGVGFAGLESADAAPRHTAKTAPTGVKAAPADVQTGGAIGSIRIEGTERIEPETVRSYLTVQPGDAFSAENLDRSLKALFATGLFADANLRRDGDTLVVRVVENPIVNRVAFEGNSHFDDKALNNEIQLKARTVYTRTRVQADVKRILDLYRHSGRFAATVTPKIIQLSQNRVDLVYEISEGKVTRIDSINFVGNKDFDTSDLQTAISTKESRWYRFLSSDDTYDPDRIAYDRELLRKFYLSKGYADFRVVSAVAELTPSRDAFIVTFTVEEGERYKVGDVHLNVGLRDLKPEDLQPYLLTATGDWYNADLVEKTINKLTDAVGDRGYAFVNIRPTITRNRAAHTLALTYDVAEGPRVYVERINVNGNVRTLDKVVRREFILAEGDAFNSSKLKRSEQNLKNLGFFKKVDVTNTQGSTPDKTVINVNVQEQSTGELSLGTGYSTTDGILGSFGIRERNLLGRGQDLRFNGQISQNAQLFDISFTEPYFLDRPLAAGIDLFDIQQNDTEQDSYEQSSLGVTLRLGFNITDDLRDTVRYTARHDKIEDIYTTASPFIQAESGSTWESIVGQTLLYDQRDNRLDPTGGYYLQLDHSYAGVGGNVSYVKEVATAAYFYEIAPKWVLGTTGEFGDVRGVGGQRVRLSDRFYVGGDQIRGFANGGVGPHDTTTDDSLGANQYYTMSATLQVPLGLPEELGLSGRIFTDAGSAYGIDLPKVTTTNQVSNSHVIRVASGVGLSWKSPLGPIRVDLGYPIKKAKYDDTEVFRVNFGTKF